MQHAARVDVPFESGSAYELESANIKSYGSMWIYLLTVVDTIIFLDYTDSSILLLGLWIFLFSALEHLQPDESIQDGGQR